MSEKKLNTTLTGEDVDAIKRLQDRLTIELGVKLSIPQIISRLVRQANEATTSSNAAHN